MSDVVICVEHLSKEYRLGTISHGTLQSDLQSWWARIRGKEDPNSIIGVEQRAERKASNAMPHAPGPMRDNPHFLALNDVSFEVRQGEVLGIIGRNGAGKSTLLKILSKVTAPTSGVVKIKGRIASLLEVGTGFHPELTGRENVYLNGAILGMTKKEITSKFDEIVAFSEIEQFIDTPVKRYSSGMYVRLAFAVAAHLEPEILIVDEVLAVGDTAFQKKCLGKMGDVAKEGRTVLFVSHNMPAITTLSERVLWLSGGRVTRDGDAESITSAYLLHGIERSGEVVIVNNSPDNPFHFNQLTFLNSQDVITSTFDVRKPIKIRLEYRAMQDMKSLEVSLRVNNSSGLPIFSTNRSSSHSSGVVRGTHVSEIEIPPLFLIPGSYSVDIGAHIPNKKVLSEYKSIAGFEIMETGSKMALYHGQAHGVVIVDLPWKEPDATDNPHP